jgi:2',3'-cyclic-nucleotide 2'-phosphodiesterase (5'-nucleotidase family)
MCVSALPQHEASPATVVPLSERLGEDDGAVAAILFGAGLRGNLEVCDCANPRGGLARRVGYTDEFKKKFSQTPVIQLEAGQFLYDASVRSELIMLQNEQVARAYSRWPVDVINLGRYDLAWARKVLLRDGLAERMSALPMLKNLISANGVFDSDVAAPPSFIIREVSGPRVKSSRRRLRIGFVGVAAPNRPSGGVYDGTVTDMFTAARKAVLAARKRSDLLVIVAHSEMEQSERLARENPEADVVIAGNAEAMYKPKYVGKTLLVCAAPGNTQEGDLRIYQQPGGKFTFTFRSLDLDAGVPSNAEALAYTNEARKELDRLRFR